MQPSRRLEDLHPALQPLAREFLARCKAAGISLTITCTFRSAEYQAQLYAQGRTQAQLNAAGVKATAQPTKPKVTNAKPGKSAHEHTEAGKPAARAFDFVPLDAAGKAVWDEKHPAWQQAGRIAVGLGLEWGGNWKFRDMPHVQLKA